jgi:hypothetical protein
MIGSNSFQHWDLKFLVALSITDLTDASTSSDW